MNTTVIVFKHSVKSLGFPKYERLDKGGPKAPDKPLLYPLEKPRIMLLVQLVVIVFKHSVNILLVFLNMRGWTKGAEGPRQASLVSS